ncbi:MAG TPA: PAS domain S-box protein, partial [Dissulfurispiraceae bacterium]|nr:PAS domain S-box protein [Dissulfurispiraceae bacterium]
MKNQQEQSEISRLRKDAEKKLKKQMERLKKLSGLDVQDLVHELGTHQIELEMQNEELRRAQEALESSRSRYVDLYDFAPVGYFTFDENGLIREVNLTGARLLGIERALLLNKPFAGFIAEAADRILFSKHRQEVSQAPDRQTCEIRLKRKDGTVFIAQFRSMAKTNIDGKAVSIHTVIVDITDRKGLEEALIRAHSELEEKVRERTAELEVTNRALEIEVAERTRAEEAQRASAGVIQDLYDNAPCGYHSLNEHGVFIRINDTELRWLGYTREEVVGGMKFRGILSPGSAEVFREHFAKFKKRGEIRDLELEMTRKDGTIFPALLSSSALRNEEGNFFMCRSTVLDISERKKAEAEAMRAARLASIGELAAGVAHEINNPINSIINYAQIISGQTGRDAPQYPMAEEIKEEGWRIAFIVKSLLGFARDTKGRKIPVAAKDIVSAALTLTSAIMRKEAITMRLTIPDDLPTVLGNPQELQQVVLNIIGNARYALQEKYPHAHDDKILEIMGETVVKDTGPAVRLIFRDHGTGIPSSALHRVHEPFFTTKPGSLGTGLGLSISSRIVADHGGRLTIDSKEGSYTEVTVELPVSVEE